MCREKRIYGCEEVTIGFYNNGHGNEIVDFMTMDSKGIIRCYEIKVTLQDLKSKAKKSWYGNYNYLVVSSDLYSKVSDWSEYIPGDVGVIKLTGSGYLMSKVKCKSRKLTDKESMMLKESMIRSMYYKMIKYKDSADMDKIKELNKKIRYWENMYRDARDDLFKAKEVIWRYEGEELGLLRSKEHSKSE